jgi:hypothetical protein
MCSNIEHEFISTNGRSFVDMLEIFFRVSKTFDSAFYTRASYLPLLFTKKNGRILLQYLRPADGMAYRATFTVKCNKKSSKTHEQRCSV